MLQQETIKLMSKGCGSLSGNAVAWQHFKNNIFGDVQVESPSWCSVIGKVIKTNVSNLFFYFMTSL